MLPYSSSLSWKMNCGTDDVQDINFGQDSGRPPTSTVAVVKPVTPVVSTVMELVPCPLVIVPAETSQLYVSLASAGAFSMEAVKVAGSPCVTVSGHETTILGHWRARGAAPPPWGSAAS